MSVHLYLPVVFFFCTSCQAQVNSNLSKDSTHQSEVITDQGLGLPKTQDELQASLDIGVDPYFVETNDTFSTTGPNCIVRNLIQDKSGNLWLATWHGIIKYDGRVFTNYTLKEGLIHFHVTSLYEDSMGNLWFGTVRGGVYRYDYKSFTLFTVKNGLPDNTAHCITEDKAGNIWLGTEKGVSRFDGKSFTNFSTEDGLSDQYVNAIIQDKRGIIWIGTKSGINWYDGTTFTSFTGKDKMPFTGIASLFEDKEGNIWIGSNAAQAGGKGLCRYDGNSINELISPGYVMYMCQDKKGNVWLAHNEGAADVYFTLYRYDGKSFTKIIKQDEPDNPVIFGITEDDSGNIWFGTAKGVCRYDGRMITYFLE